MRYTQHTTFLLIFVSLITTNILSAQFSQAEVFFQQGKIYQKENQFSHALDFYNLTLSENHSHLNALYSRSQVRYKLGHFTTAIYDLDHLLSISPFDAKALELRGLIHFDQGNKEMALSDFENSLSYQRTAQGFLNIGIVLKSMGRYEEALDNFTYATEIQRNMSAAHCGKADTYVAMGEKYFSNALENYATALIHNPNDIFTLKNRGKLYLMVGDFENAVDDFNTAIYIQPDFELYLHLAQCRLEQRQWEEAEDILVNHAMKMKENDPEIYFTLGLVEKAMGRSDDALESFKVAADYDIQNMNYQVEIGFAEYQLGNPYGAIHAFNQYLKLGGDDSDAEIETLITACYDIIELETEHEMQIHFVEKAETNEVEESGEFQSRGIPASYLNSSSVKKDTFSEDIFEQD